MSSYTRSRRSRRRRGTHGVERWRARSRAASATCDSTVARAAEAKRASSASLGLRDERDGVGYCVERVVRSFSVCQRDVALCVERELGVSTTRRVVRDAALRVRSSRMKSSVAVSARSRLHLSKRVLCVIRYVSIDVSIHGLFYAHFLSAIATSHSRRVGVLLTLLIQRSHCDVHSASVSLSGARSAFDRV